MKEYKLDPVTGGTCIMMLDWVLTNKEVRAKLDKMSKGSFIHYINMTKMALEQLRMQEREVLEKEPRIKAITPTMENDE